jgi:hypothetical protein
MSANLANFPFPIVSAKFVPLSVEAGASFWRHPLFGGVGSASINKNMGNVA